VGDAIAFLCSTCYRSSSHEGHTFTLRVASSTGDYCSCGDPEVWTRPVPCSSHPIASNSLPAIPEPICTSSDSRPLPTSHEQHPQLHPIPDRNHRAVHRTLSVIIEYILETLDSSPEETSLPKTAVDLYAQPSSEPGGIVFRPDGGMREMTFSVVLWNDEKHTREDVMVQLGDAAGMSDKDGWKLAERLHAQGREIIETSPNIARVLHIAHTLAQIDLGVTLRASYDTFRECVSASLVALLLDLCSCSVFPGLANEDPTFFRSVLADVLMEQRSASTDTFEKREKAGLDKFRGGVRTVTRETESEADKLTRADWLLMYHTKLWKKPREQMTQLLTKLTMVDQGTRLKLCESGRAVLISLQAIRRIG
jgi:E3 ubiquitin-protein ligase UBR1